MPLRRVEIEKRGGGKRTIAILAVRDRIAQRAVLNVIEPLFEEQFLDSSYGFRPGRSVQDAVRRIVEYRAEGCEWVLDGDINAFFDSIDQQLLMRFVRRTIKDRKVLCLIEAWLEVGVMKTISEERGSKFNLDGLLKIGVSYLEQALGWGMRYLVNRGEGPYYLDEAIGYEPIEVDDASARREALKRLGADGLLLALSLSRPLVGKAKEALPALKRLVKKRGAIFAGLASLGAILIPLARWALREEEALQLGTPQGGVLSPLLANVYLHQFDLAMARQGYRLVRYADDFLVLCTNRDEAMRAWRDAERILARLRLELNEEKTRVVHFDDGFNFLGVRFGCEEAIWPEAGGSHQRKILREMRRVVETVDQHSKKALQKGKELASHLIKAPKRSR
jgi:RNA-directed DNA polymerase